MSGSVVKWIRRNSHNPWACPLLGSHFVSSTSMHNWQELLVMIEWLLKINNSLKASVLYLLLYFSCTLLEVIMYITHVFNFTKCVMTHICFSQYSVREDSASDFVPSAVMSFLHYCDNHTTISKHYTSSSLNTTVAHNDHVN